MDSDGVRTVFNLFTQEHSRGHNSTPGKAKTSYVNHALRELRKSLESEKIESIAIPKLATGVGGLEWEEVKGLINKHLADLPVDIYVYTTFKKGEAAH